VYIFLPVSGAELNSSLRLIQKDGVNIPRQLIGVGFQRPFQNGVSLALGTQTFNIQQLAAGASQ